MNPIRVFIDGQEGTTGLKLFDRLSRRPDVALMRIPEDQRKDPDARRAYLNQAQVVFLCLPDAAAREAVALIDNPTVRVIDASTAHRVQDGWTYGFAELSGVQRQAIVSGSRVAVPGCHATGFVALTAPLVAAGLLPRDYPVSCHSITGYSGGGKQMIADYENPARTAAFSGSRIYALTLRHKHLPEMQRYAGLNFPPLFDPIVGDFAQGMLVSVPLHLRLMPCCKGVEALHAALTAHYADSRFVSVQPFSSAILPDGGQLDPQALNGTNRMELFVFGQGDQALLVARLDNLGKGASGAAVQVFNLMAGTDEGEGL